MDTSAPSVRPPRPADLVARVLAEHPLDHETIRLSAVGRPAGYIAHLVQRWIVVLPALVGTVTASLIRDPQAPIGPALALGAAIGATATALLTLLQRWRLGPRRPALAAAVISDQRVLLVEAIRPDEVTDFRELPAGSVTWGAVDHPGGFWDNSNVARLTLGDDAGPVTAIDLGLVDLAAARGLLEQAALEVRSLDPRADVPPSRLPWVLWALLVVLGFAGGAIALLCAVALVVDGSPVGAVIAGLVGFLLLGGATHLVRTRR